MTQWGDVLRVEKITPILIICCIFVAYVNKIRVGTLKM